MAGLPHIPDKARNHLSNVTVFTNFTSLLCIKLLDPVQLLHLKNSTGEILPMNMYIRGSTTT